MSLTEAQRLRADIRTGAITASSRGMALGFVQCNLVILPQAWLADFLGYCAANPRACPVLEVGHPGDPVSHRMAPGADLRTDVARYAIWRDGARQPDRIEIADLWHDDLVFVLIGSGISFDAALEEAGIRTDRFRWVLATDRPTVPCGPFSGNLVVTMRWMTPEEADRAAAITARMPDYHGAPLHLGTPDGVGADLDGPIFGGPVPQMPPGLTAVFWACGVTPQAAAENAGLPLMITHAPAHSFITDTPMSTLVVTP